MIIFVVYKAKTHRMDILKGLNYLGQVYIIGPSRNPIGCTDNKAHSTQYPFLFMNSLSPCSYYMQSSNTIACPMCGLIKYASSFVDPYTKIKNGICNQCLYYSLCQGISYELSFI